MADKKLPYYRMYPADAETDENFRLLTDEELGFYWRCLNASWNNTGLPEDPEMRARSLRTERSEADRKWVSVVRCFDLQSGRYVNNRQEKERALALQKSIINAAAGKASAERRFNACSTPVEQQEPVEQRAYDSDASSIQRTVVLPVVSSIQRTVTTRSPKKPIPFKTTLQATAFAEFWEVYPFRKSKPAAIKAYKAQVKSTGEHRVMLAGLRDRLEGLLASTPGYEPHPSTWLNNRRWEDENRSAEETEDARLDRIVKEMEASR